MYHVKQKMVDGVSYRNALDQIVKQPFGWSLILMLASGGGQWMKKEFNLNPEMENYGWAFDGVPKKIVCVRIFQE